MDRPKLACCNFIPEARLLKQFALDHGLDGVDWSFTLENLPENHEEEAALVKTIASLHPLEVRYHCACDKTDLGDTEAEDAERAMDIFRRVCRIVSRLGGHFLTVHVGLGRESTSDLSWRRTVAGLVDLVRFAQGLDVHVCLENLAWGWTSRPELFEKLIRKSGCWVTLDVGHARVSPSITSHRYDLQDFIVPHPERCLHAHIYHEEDENGHLAPGKLADVKKRLQLLTRLPQCDWWVLELWEQESLLDTLRTVRAFFESELHDERSLGYGSIKAQGLLLP